MACRQRKIQAPIFWTDVHRRGTEEDDIKSVVGSPIIGGGRGASEEDVCRAHRVGRFGVLALGCLGVLIWISIAALWSAAADAVPAAPIKITLEQPNGETFKARQFGDEFNNGVETDEGYTIVRAPETRAWQYAEEEAGGALAPSGARAEDDPPPEIEEGLRPEPELRADAFQRAEDLENPDLAIPNTGAQKSLVLLVRFQDQASVGSTPAQWNSKFFGAANSVRDYYDEVSYGNLTINPAAESHGAANDGVVGWLTLNQNHPNTGKNTGEANRLLTRNAISAANPYVNFASYDTNGDGYLSSQELHVTVIVAGQEASCCGHLGKSVWGHRWALFGTERPTVDGVVVGDHTRGGGYTQFGEWHGDHMATIGIMVHEMGHDLYLPDMYDTDGSSEGVGRWSVMGGGTWLATAGNHAGSTPAHPDPFSKWYQGWLTPQQITGSGTPATIPQAETSATAIQLLNNPGGIDWTFGGSSGTGEYFLVENRQRVGYDAALPGTGLLVWHIDEARPTGGTANANDFRRLIDVEEADGLRHLDLGTNGGDAGDPYPGSSGNTRFDGTSNPNSRLYSGSSSGAAISNISGSSPTMSATISTPGGGVANDNLANAQTLTGANATVNGGTNGATKEAGEPNHAGNPGGKSVWYKWIPQSNGATTIDTFGSGFDTLLGVYTGSTVGNLAEIASNDDEDNPNGVITSELSFEATAGTTYRIAVDGYNNEGAGAESGSVTLNLASEATVDTEDPSVSLTAPQEGAVVSGDVTLSAEATDNVGVERVEFLVGASVVGTDTTAANGGYSAEWDSTTVPEDGEYRISARAYDAAGNTAITPTRGIIVDNTPTVDNDDLADAQALTGASDTTTGGTNGATKQGSEPNHAGNIGGKSVWYRWTPKTSGTATIDAQGSDFDTLLGVYTGSSVNGLTEVASNDDEDYPNDVLTSAVEFPVTADTTYRIAVDGYNNQDAGAESGSVTLNLASEAAADTENPTVALTAPQEGRRVGSDVTLSAEATDNVGVTKVEFRMGQTWSAPTRQPQTAASTAWRGTRPPFRRTARTPYPPALTTARATRRPRRPEGSS